MPYTVALKIEAFDSRFPQEELLSPARSLAAAISSRGHEARVLCMDHWGFDDLDVDLVVHLGGDSRPVLKDWNVNFLLLPERGPALTDDERKVYDAVIETGLSLAEPGGEAENVASRLLSLYQEAHEARDRAAKMKLRAGKKPEREPLVSVLMSTCNRREFLPAAIASVLEQGHSKLELVLVNDGGVEVSDIVEAFADSRIRYLRLDAECGKSAAVNAAFEASRGEYVAYLDDDDVWYPNHLETLLFALTRVQDVRMAYTDAWQVRLGKNGKGFVETERNLPHRHQVDIRHLLEYNHITGISVCHDRELFREAGGMDERLPVLIDWDLWRRMAAVTRPCHLSRATAEYYIRGGGTTSGTGQITNLYFTDRPRYMAERLRIINKELQGPEARRVRDELPACRKRARSDFLTARGGYFEDLGRYERAAKSYDLAVRVAPGETGPLRAAGHFALRRGNFDKALCCFRKAVGLRTADEADHLNLALALKGAGDEAGSLKVARGIGQRFDPHPEVRRCIEKFWGPRTLRGAVPPAGARP